jgi:hypothetical protein
VQQLLNRRRDPGYDQRVNANRITIERCNERTKLIVNEFEQLDHEKANKKPSATPSGGCAFRPSPARPFRHQPRSIADLPPFAVPIHLALLQRLRGTGAVRAREGVTDLISDHMTDQDLQQICRQLG